MQKMPRYNFIIRFLDLLIIDFSDCWNLDFQFPFGLKMGVFSDLP